MRSRENCGEDGFEDAMTPALKKANKINVMF